MGGRRLIPSRPSRILQGDEHVPSHVAIHKRKSCAEPNGAWGLDSAVGTVWGTGTLKTSSWTDSEDPTDWQFAWVHYLLAGRISAFDIFE